MISAAGCASKDVVKKEEPLATTTKSAAAPAASTKTAPEQLKKPAPSAQIAIPQQTAKAKMSQIAFEKVYFDFDSSDLSKSARDALTRDSEILLKERSDAKLRIEGNCDERGSAEYNLALGERRAKAAAKYLTALGVQPVRISVLSYGKERPAVQGNDEAAWSKNRRDEFVIQK
jgi:peptidoglycan-associated lipoprotein